MFICLIVYTCSSGEPPDVPLGGEPDGHHVVLVDEVERHVPDLASRHNNAHTSISDSLDLNKKTCKRDKYVYTLRLHL